MFADELPQQPLMRPHRNCQADNLELGTSQSHRRTVALERQGGAIEISGAICAAALAERLTAGV